MNKTTKWIIISLLLIGGMFYNCKSGLIVNFSPRNLDYVKERAEIRWNELGFDIVGYEGFQWHACYFKKHGGALVYYTLRKPHYRDQPEIVYEGALQRWGDEIHAYNIEAVDAIKP